MKCPKCRKTIRNGMLRCPRCNMMLPKRKKRSAKTAILISLVVFFLAVIGSAGYFLLSGEAAAYYLRKGDDSKAVTLLDWFSPGRENKSVIKETLHLAEQYRADYKNGAMRYDEAEKKLQKLASVSENQTADQVESILNGIRSDHQTTSAKREVDLLMNAGDYEGALHRIQSFETSETWSAFTVQERTNMTEMKWECADRMVDIQLDRVHVFDDGNGKGALHLAHDCIDWYPELFRKTDAKVKSALKAMNTPEDWQSMVQLITSGIPELNGYLSADGFVYSDYITIQMTAVTERSAEECEKLLALINEERKANGLKPLESSQMLRRLAGSMTGKLYVTEEMFDRAKKTEGAGNLKNDCYMYLFHTALLSDGVLDEMRNDRMTKQGFRSEEETMLTADWIRSFGAAMMIRSDGTMYWFLIASGDPAA